MEVDATEEDTDQGSRQTVKKVVVVRHSSDPYLGEGRDPYLGEGTSTSGSTTDGCKPKRGSSDREAPGKGSPNERD